MRAWAAEVDAAGVSVLSSASKIDSYDNRPSAADSAGEAGRRGWRAGGSATHRVQREEGATEVLVGDLEGGSRAVRGRVPLLVVGNKKDVGEGVQCAGGALALELGAAHVTVVSEGGRLKAR